MQNLMVRQGVDIDTAALRDARFEDAASTIVWDESWSGESPPDRTKAVRQDIYGRTECTDRRRTKSSALPSEGA